MSTATYEVNWGESVDHAIAGMRAQADAAGAVVTAQFNEVELVVAPGATQAAVKAEWHAELQRRSDAYRASPEGRAAAAKRVADVAAQQRDTDALIEEMRSTLNAEDIPGLIRWFDKLTDAADDVGVRSPSSEILTWFADRGYEPGVNTGSEYRPDDRENTARYLIGQALDGVRTCGVPHPIFHKFAAEWLSA